MPAGTFDQLPHWAEDLLGSARAGHLGLIDTSGRPRVLPVTYALAAGAVWTVIDNKPKRADRPPARLRWLAACPQAALTVDSYAEDWSRLAWVQLLGRMTVLGGPPGGPGLSARVDRYPQYRADPPPGPLLRLGVDRAVWWRAVDRVA